MVIGPSGFWTKPAAPQTVGCWALVLESCYHAFSQVCTSIHKYSQVFTSIHKYSQVFTSIFRYYVLFFVCVVCVSCLWFGWFELEARGYRLCCSVGAPFLFRRLLLGAGAGIDAGAPSDQQPVR